MAYVPEITQRLTGKTRLVRGWFGPRLEVEVDVFEWDTNTGYDAPMRTVWRKAKNTDIAELTYVDLRT